MGRFFFWLGWLFFAIVPWSSSITGRDFSAAQRAEGYAIAACIMVYGIGLRVFRANRQDKGE